MTPLQHAQISAKRYGGAAEDYQDIHEFFDQTKAFVPDMRHRAYLHNSFGIFLAAQMFGKVRVNSEGRAYSVRHVAEDHVLEDLGFIPSLNRIIESIDKTELKWLGGPPANKRKGIVESYRQREAENKQRANEED